VHPKQSMTRVVRAPDGSLALDASGRAAGRGTYLCDAADCHEPTRLAEGVRRALGSDVGLEPLIGELTHASA
jgi:predicted RNA-binding protein YlxR (DUF448 family)